MSTYSVGKSEINFNAILIICKRIIKLLHCDNTSAVESEYWFWIDWLKNNIMNIKKIKKLQDADNKILNKIIKVIDTDAGCKNDLQKEFDMLNDMRRDTKMSKKMTK